MKKLLKTTIITIFFISCAKNDYILHDRKIIEYRSGIDPMNRISKNLKNENFLPSYERFYSLWLAEHRTLEQNLDKQSFLIIVKSHKNIHNLLDNMGAFLSPIRGEKLRGYQKLYDHLLQDVKKKISLRVVFPRYRHLKKNIQLNFAPENISKQQE